MLDIENGAFLDFHWACWKSFPTDTLKMRRGQENRHFQIFKAISTNMDAEPTGEHRERLVGVWSQAQMRRLP
jgi:hypothetical protein